MRYFPVVRAGVLLYALISLLSVMTSPPAYAEGGVDSVRDGMTILSIDYINYDCYPDTVWGKREGPLNAPAYLPHLIFWGSTKDNGRHDGRDTSRRCKGHIPQKFKVLYTRIAYPSWENISGSITVWQFNPEDTLADMLFALRGVVGAGEERRDTTRFLLIFGQHGLDTLTTIDLASITTFQAEPFTAAELRKGIEVVNEKKRDLSGRRSYELLPVGFTIQEPDSAPRGVPGALAGVAIRVYPNPARIATQVEAETIPPGAYTLEVVAVNGEALLRQEVEVRESGALLRTFDLHDLPSGYYIIRVSKESKLFGTYPVVVTR